MIAIERRGTRTPLRTNSEEMAEQAGRARRVLGDLMHDYTGPVAFRLWNDEFVIGNERAPCVLTFRRPSALRELILHRNLLRTAEAHLRGEIEVTGDVEVLFSLTDFLTEAHWSPSQCARAVWDAFCLPAGHAGRSRQRHHAAHRLRRNSRASISHHYDLGNGFYRLWLDPEMVYSCAYFDEPAVSLAEAQRRKLDYICRKLRLAPEHRVLDIGCGWGALLFWAVKRYGVRGHGITLSKEQHEYAKARIHDEGLEGRVTVELRDYRDLPSNARYDRIVSVGMFEHIGLKNFARYFDTVHRALKPGGLFLNHGITNESGWRRTPLTQFINRYIFPDGELTRISEVCAAMESAGFELLDIESLRRHYALTLRHWVKALEASRTAAIRMSSEAVFRLWRLYMAGSAYYFENGRINVYQVLAGRAQSPLLIPLTRDDLYSYDGESRRAPAARA